MFEFDFIWILQQTMHVQKNQNVMKANALIIYGGFKIKNARIIHFMHIMFMIKKNRIKEMRKLILIYWFRKHFYNPSANI